ncbi:hypothetical protein Purlil1_768 [Purpureocillium lilacinum]|uniref:Uncharacterized protein n=1 Tax=Purpureocillium lilacinum TaxID=33203 RepID=A0ABR0CFR2_PURLI|nr:hypothetical protein Purlil1_768 [Purpureocillium lilacinum]
MFFHQQGMNWSCYGSSTCWKSIDGGYCPPTSKQPGRPKEIDRLTAPNPRVGGGGNRQGIHSSSLLTPGVGAPPPVLLLLLLLRRYRPRCDIGNHGRTAARPRTHASQALGPPSPNPQSPSILLTSAPAEGAAAARARLRSNCLICCCSSYTLPDRPAQSAECVQNGLA